MYDQYQEAHSVSDPYTSFVSLFEQKGSFVA